jgi:nickel-dependent lactate racemase
MPENNTQHQEKIPYGKGELEVKIPRKNYLAALMPHYKPGLKDEAGAIRQALGNPIGTRRLKEIARGKKSAVIVVNDITRPTATCPQEVIDRFIREGYSIGASKAWLFSRCLKRSDLILVSKSIEDKILKEMFTQRADTVDQAIQMALAKQGKNAEILLLKNGSDMIPRFEGR